MSKPTGPKKSRGLTSEKWSELRAKFEAGASEVALALEYGVDRKTIRARKRKECWTPQVFPHLGKVEADAARERAQAKVIDIATGKAIEAAAASGDLQLMGQEIGAAMLATATASRLASEYIVDLLTKAANGEIEPASGPGEQTVADVAKAVMSAYRTFTSTVRESAGLRPGQSSIADSGDTDQPIEVLQRRLDPVSVPVDERGRALPQSEAS